MFSSMTNLIETASSGDTTKASVGMPSKWSRKSLAIASSTLTILTFSLDSFWQNSQWGGLSYELVFYALGVLTAIFYVKVVQGGVHHTKPKKFITKGGGCISSIQKQARADKKSSSPKLATSVEDTDACIFAESFDQTRTRPSVAPQSTRSNGTHSTIAMAASKQGPAAAGAALRRIQSAGTEVDTTSYNIIIQAYAKRGDVQKAQDWLERLLGDGLQPDEYSFSALLCASAKNGADNGCLQEWIDRMASHGIVVTAATYTNLIYVFARNCDDEQASFWLTRMEESGLKPDAAIYNALIYSCCAQSFADRAKWWYERMNSQGLSATVTTFTQLIDVCAKTLDLSGAEHWMEAMISLGIEPNVVSYSTMINVCAKVRDLERAEHWYIQMQEHDVQPNMFIFSALINACARVGDVNAACSWLERAQGVGAPLDGVVYGCVINACAKVGDSTRAMTVFKQMRSIGIQSHIVTYAALARPFAYAGEWEEVERIAEMLKADGIAMNDYFLYTLLLSYSRAKPRESARAEAAFVAAMNEGIATNDRIEKVLTSALGKARSSHLIQRYCQGNA